MEALWLSRRVAAEDVADSVDSQHPWYVISHTDHLQTCLAEHEPLPEFILVASTRKLKFP